MQTEKQIRRAYEEAEDIVCRYKDEVTLDAVALEAKLTVEILGKVLHVKK